MTAPQSHPTSLDPETLIASIGKGVLVDITTTGRRSGEPHRIEVGIFSFGGRLYISGMPGRRSWLANLVADPRMTLHVKGQVTGDVRARARVINEPGERRALLERITRHWRREAAVDAFVASSPLIEVVPEGTLPTA